MPFNQVYLDTASLGLTTLATIRAAQQFTEELGSGRLNKAALDDLVIQTRKAAKSFLGISEGTLSFTPPFGFGLLQIASSLQKPLKALVLSDDYPSFQTIWQDAGHPVVIFHKEMNELIDYAQLFSSIEAHQAEVLIISHVNYRSGEMADLTMLDDFCTKKNILLIVDATQSLGLVPLSLTATPGYLLLASCYKWLGAGYGLGIRYTSPFARQFFDKKGYCKRHGSGSDEAVEISHYNFDALVRFRAALNHYEVQNIQHVYGHVQQLVQRLVNGLDCNNSRLVLPPTAILSGIVSLEDRPGLYDQLLKGNYRVAQKEAIIRISPHWYNTLEDIDAILTQLNC